MHSLCDPLSIALVSRRRRGPKGVIPSKKLRRLAGVVKRLAVAIGYTDDEDMKTLSAMIAGKDKDPGEKPGDDGLFQPESPA